MAVYAPRYAHAFAQVVKAKSLDVAAAREQLRDFADTLAGSDELREVLLNPSIAEEQKLRVVDAIAARIGMFREVRNFIAVIIDHQRLAGLDEILGAYSELVDEGAGLAEADIATARPLNEDDRVQLEAEVSKLAGGRVRATYREDPALLGGVVVRIGSTIYDGSVRAQLEQLKNQLIKA